MRVAVSLRKSASEPAGPPTATSVRVCVANAWRATAGRRRAAAWRGSSIPVARDDGDLAGVAAAGQVDREGGLRCAGRRSRPRWPRARSSRSRTGRATRAAAAPGPWSRAASRGTSRPWTRRAEAADELPGRPDARRQAGGELPGAAGQLAEAGLELARAVAQGGDASGQLAAAAGELGDAGRELAVAVLQLADAGLQLLRAGVELAQTGGELRDLAAERGGDRRRRAERRAEDCSDVVRPPAAVERTGSRRARPACCRSPAAPAPARRPGELAGAARRRCRRRR